MIIKIWEIIQGFHVGINYSHQKQIPAWFFFLQNKHLLKSYSVRTVLRNVIYLSTYLFIYYLTIYLFIFIIIIIIISLLLLLSFFSFFFSCWIGSYQHSLCLWLKSERCRQVGWPFGKIQLRIARYVWWWNDESDKKLMKNDEKLLPRIIHYIHREFPVPISEFLYFIVTISGSKNTKEFIPT